jgi:hypothetical protein
MASEEQSSLVAEARKHLFTTFKNTTAFFSSNRYKILQSIVILLRLGQVAAVAIVALIFFFMIFEISIHYCQYYPQDWQCLYHSDLTNVPFSYVLVLAAVSIPTSECRAATYKAYRH